MCQICLTHNILRIGFRMYFNTEYICIITHTDSLVVFVFFVLLYLPPPQICYPTYFKTNRIREKRGVRGNGEREKNKIKVRCIFIHFYKSVRGGRVLGWTEVPATEIKTFKAFFILFTLWSTLLLSFIIHLEKNFHNKRKLARKSQKKIVKWAHKKR